MVEQHWVFDERRSLLPEVSIETLSGKQAGLVLAKMDYGGHPSLLSPDTAELPDKIRAASRKRQIEFIAGRYCAAIAMKELGIFAWNVPIGEDGQPVWPDQVIGSISHSNGFALAVVGSKLRYSALGVDIETIIAPEVASEIVPILMTDHELSILGETFSPVTVTSIFSAKESLFKALSPSLKTGVDFTQFLFVGWSDQSTAKLIVKHELFEAASTDETFDVAISREGEFVQTLTAIAR